MTYNSLRGLRDTLPKNQRYSRNALRPAQRGQAKERGMGAQANTPTLNSLMSRYNVNQPMQGAQTASVGSQNAQQSQNALAVGSRYQRGGRSGDLADPGLSDQQAADQASVGNAANAGDVASVAMGAAPMGMGTALGVGVNAMADVLGPHGVTGMDVSPAVGTASFDQATPAADAAPGVTDAGATAVSIDNANLSPQAAMGNMAAPASDLGVAGLPSMSDIAAGALDSIGLGFSNEEAGFSGVAGNVGMGAMGGAPGANSDLSNPGPGVGGGPNAASGGSMGASPSGSGGVSGPGPGAAGSGGTGATGPDGPAGSGQGAF